MKTPLSNLGKPVWVTFTLVFAVCLALGVAVSIAQTVTAAPNPAPQRQGVAGYGTSEACAACHTDTHETWSGTLHSQAFSSPIFQEDWVKAGSANACLECHTTGFDPATGSYAEEGVTCQACHGPLQPGHPENPMPITPDYTLCARCHKTTTDEWRASKHGQVNLNCESCHNSHSQQPRAASVNELCTNCHKDTGSS